MDKKIDNYLIDLKLKRKKIKNNIDDLLVFDDKNYINRKLKSYNFDKIKMLREKEKEISNKIKFIENLKRRGLNNEMHDKKN